MIRSALLGLGVRVLRVKRDDVIVVRGGDRVPLDWRASINRAVHKRTGAVVLFLPRNCDVTIEGRALDAEDRGYRRHAARK